MSGADLINELNDLSRRLTESVSYMRRAGKHKMPTKLRSIRNF